MAKNVQEQVPNLMLRAFMDEMTRRLNEALGPIEDRLHNIETNNQRPNNGGPVGRLREQEQEGELVQNPPFKGKSDPEAYIEWETRMEKIFTYQEYPDARKVQIASLEFSDYALTWWDQLVTSRRRNREEPVNTWVEMKRIMRKRFVPSYYHRSLLFNLQTLTQGTKSVEEYYQEMETCMIRANIEEEAEATMARFLQGLNSEIKDEVEMHNYINPQDLFHQATKVEAQIKRKNQIRRNSSSYNFYNSKPWCSSFQKQEKPTFEPQSLANQEVSTPKFEIKSQQTSSSSTPQPKTQDLNCCKCQGLGHIASECVNNKTLVMNTLGELDSKSESLEIESKKSSFENKNENEIVNVENSSQNESESKEGSIMVSIGKEKEKSELESEIVSYHFLQVPLCKELFLYSNPLAGPIPSNKTFLLQTYGGSIPNEVPYIMPLPMVKEQQVDKGPLLQGITFLGFINSGEEVKVAANQEETEVSLVKGAFFHEAYLDHNQFAFDPGGKKKIQVRVDMEDSRTNLFEGGGDDTNGMELTTMLNKDQCINFPSYGAQ